MEKTVKQTRVQVMSRLLEASKLLNSTLDVKQLLHIILDLATDSCKADRGTIYLIDHATNEIWSHVMKEDQSIDIRLPLGEGIAGIVAKTGETINIKDAYKDPRFSSKTDKQSGYRTKSILTMPMRNSSGKIIGVFQLLNKSRGTFNSQDESYLSLLSVHASLAVENALLHKAALEKERIERELNIAASIQKLILPNILPTIKGIDIKALNIPSRSVSGDYYDAIVLNDHQLIVVIADVAGKGVPAALLVSTMQAWLHALSDGKLGLSALVSRLNIAIEQGTTVERYITFFIALIDTKEKTIEYVNAGHLPQLLIHHSSPGDLTKLSVGGFPLGMFSGADYLSEKRSFDDGDALALFTDGLTEALSENLNELAKESSSGLPDSVFFGDERVNEFFAASLHLPTAEVLPNLFSEIQEFSKGAEQSDDMTALYIRMTGQ